MKITNKVTEGASHKDTTKFQIGLYEYGKYQPIKVPFQSSNVMEDVMRNTKKLREEEEMTNIYIQGDA